LDWRRLTNISEEASRPWQNKPEEGLQVAAVFGRPGTCMYEAYSAPVLQRD
jgi:hypothetical protein